jgi:hypothetical protein
MTAFFGKARVVSEAPLCPFQSSRSFRFFELSTYADTGPCPAERPCFLLDHIMPPVAEELRQNRLKGYPQTGRFQVGYEPQMILSQPDVNFGICGESRLRTSIIMIRNNLFFANKLFYLRNVVICASQSRISVPYMKPFFSVTYLKTGQIRDGAAGSSSGSPMDGCTELVSGLDGWAMLGCRMLLLLLLAAG